MASKFKHFSSLAVFELIMFSQYLPNKAQCLSRDIRCPANAIHNVLAV